MTHKVTVKLIDTKKFSVEFNDISAMQEFLHLMVPKAKWYKVEKL